MGTPPAYSIEPIGNGWYIVSDGVQRWRVAMAEAGDSRWVFLNGQVAQIETAAPSAERKRSKGRGDTAVMAPMPATVVTISAAPGQRVSQGDTLIVLEAMKMELPLRAPRDGMVKAVHCAKGDLVQPGVHLLEFE